MQRKTINLLRGLAVLAGITSIVVFAPIRACFVYLAPLSSDIQTEAERAISAGLDGVIIYIDQAGTLTDTAYTAGWHNRANKQPAQHDALFKIGSISKLYVAAAVTQLISSGILDADTTLISYLPTLASRIDNAEKITLRMLVQHRSGIPNYTDAPDFPWFAPFDEATDTRESLAFIYDKPANFAPDETYEYSNTNYLLLGEIIDKTLGYRYQDYIATRILQPLGLTDTFGSVKRVPQQRLMSGYMPGYDHDLKGLAFMSPAGAMVATAKDVANFVRALNDGSLFTPEEQMLYHRLYTDSHDGWLPGYLSFARYNKTSDTVIVLFTNTSGDEPWLIGDITSKRILTILTETHQQ